jgi:DNA-binding NtrC family response regulator
MPCDAPRRSAQLKSRTGRVLSLHRQEKRSLAGFAVSRLIDLEGAQTIGQRAPEALATGCDEFDAKPIEFESLVATIRRVLAKTK